MRGPAIADAQAALQQGSGSLAELQYQAHGIFEKLVMLGFFGFAAGSAFAALVIFRRFQEFFLVFGGRLLARADDEWDDRARAAYLEPWGPGLEAVLDLALPVGSFAYAFGFLRLWDHLDEVEREPYRAFLPRILRRAYERWTSAFSSTSTRRGFEPS